MASWGRAALSAALLIGIAGGPGLARGESEAARAARLAREQERHEALEQRIEALEHRYELEERAREQGDAAAAPTGTPESRDDAPETTK